MHFCYYKITITYSGNPLPNNNATIYTKPKPAHSYKSSSSNYDSMGDSGSKIISSDPPNVENEHKKDKNLFQERQSLNYNSTASGHKSSEAITFANQIHRTTRLNSLNTGRYVPPEESRLIYNAF